MRLVTIALACAALTVLAGCNRKSETDKAPPPAAAAPATPTPTAPNLKLAEGFRHQDKFDAAGFYLSAQPVRVGDYRLVHVGIGAPSDFNAWEKGERASVYGPIVFQFEDLARAAEIAGAGDTRTNGVKVLPTAYSFAPGEITFVGSDPKLGEVVFSGVFDEAALNRARNEGATDATVLRGMLKVGNAEPKPVSLVYLVGE